MPPKKYHAARPPYTKTGLAPGTPTNLERIYPYLKRSPAGGKGTGFVATSQSIYPKAAWFAPVAARMPKEYRYKGKYPRQGFLIVAA